MENVVEIKDFIDKFQKLSIENQKYIIAIQQALIFAQSGEEKRKRECRRDLISASLETIVSER